MGRDPKSSHTEEKRLGQKYQMPNSKAENLAAQN